MSLTNLNCQKKNVCSAIGLFSEFFAFLLFIFTVFGVYQARQRDELLFFAGYRPVIVLTGSMEPSIPVYSLLITKQIKEINQLSVGDIVTYHVGNSSLFRSPSITHRIIKILDDGGIVTKGDNNHVTDPCILSIDNIDAKVVGIYPTITIYVTSFLISASYLLFFHSYKKRTG